MISVLILTKNEEAALPGCLESVAWSDDVHVYDSGSTDGTAAVALANGAHFTVSPGSHQSHFDNHEADYKNRAIKTLPFKYPWVLYLDADERATPELAESARRAVQHPDGNVAFRIQRRDFFLETWLKHVQMTSFYMRLFRHNKVNFERPVHSACIPDGPVANLAGYIDHFPFSKGVSQWLSRHNDFSSIEARHIVASRAAGLEFDLLKTITAKDLTERRFHQKELFYRMPGRPLVKFCALYLAKGGFLDGYAGFTYSVLQAIYEYMIILKTRELQLPHKFQTGLSRANLAQPVSKL